MKGTSLKSASISYGLRGLVACSAFAFAAVASAQTSWTGLGFSSYYWFDSGNWTAGIPNASTDAQIFGTATFTPQASIDTGETAATNSLSVLDAYVNVGGTLNVNGNFSLNTSSYYSQVDVGGAGSMANIGTLGSSIVTENGTGSASATIVAQSTGVMNINAFSFEESGYAFLDTWSNSATSINATDHILLGSSLSNIGGTVSLTAPQITFGSGYLVATNTGTINLNAGMGTSALTVNHGTFQVLSANLFEGGNFYSDWFVNTANSNLYFGYDSLGNATSSISFINGQSTVYLMNDQTFINGDLYNGGVIQLGTYTQSGGALTISGSLHDVGANTAISFYNGANVKIGGDYIAGDSGLQVPGGTEVWGGSSVQIAGNLELNHGSAFFIQDLD